MREGASDMQTRSKLGSDDKFSEARFTAEQDAAE
jgi:hypothetical protein